VTEERPKKISHPKIVAAASTPDPERKGAKKSSDYEKVADKVGLVPNVRAGDNIFQAAFVGGAVLLCVVASLVFGLGRSMIEGALIGAVVGLVVGGLVSGLALMVRGLLRP
jgi:hypothetical protein